MTMPIPSQMHVAWLAGACMARLVMTILSVAFGLFIFSKCFGPTISEYSDWFHVWFHILCDVLFTTSSNIFKNYWLGNYLLLVLA